MKLRPTLLALLACAPLAGCDLFGIESGATVAARSEAEGKAIGSACRHAMRAIEDCYILNPKAVKASVYAGWREMDEYMRENKLEGVTPVVPRPDPAAAKKKPAASAPDEEIIESPRSDAKDHAKDHGKPTH